MDMQCIPPQICVHHPIANPAVECGVGGSKRVIVHHTLCVGCVAEIAAVHGWREEEGVGLFSTHQIVNDEMYIATQQRHTCCSAVTRDSICHS